MAPSLFIFRGNDQGVRFELSADVLGLGRDASNAIQLHDTEVSRRHAEIRRADKAFVLADLGSSNGTYVNGKRVTMAYLGAADRIAIGPVECELELPAGQAQLRTVGESASAGSGSGRSKWIVIAVLVLLLGAAAVWWLR